jgi:hypothetical protein
VLTVTRTRTPSTDGGADCPTCDEARRPGPEACAAGPDLTGTTGAGGVTGTTCTLLEDVGSSG